MGHARHKSCFNLVTPTKCWSSILRPWINDVYPIGQRCITFQRAHILQFHLHRIIITSVTTDLTSWARSRSHEIVNTPTNARTHTCHIFPFSSHEDGGRFLIPAENYVQSVCQRVSINSCVYARICLVFTIRPESLISSQSFDSFQSKHHSVQGVREVDLNVGPGWGVRFRARESSTIFPWGCSHFLNLRNDSDVIGSVHRSDERERSQRTIVQHDFFLPTFANYDFLQHRVRLLRHSVDF